MPSYFPALPGRDRRVFVNFNDIYHQINLSVARHALVRRRVDGEDHTMEALADSVGRSRSTVSRWFAGKPTSLSVPLTIMGKLGLRSDDVYTRCEVELER